MKYVLTAVCFASMVGINIAHAALTIRSTNLIGFNATTSAIVDNAGNVISNGEGIIAVGTFGALSDSDIQNLGSASAISSSFDIVGSTAFNSGDGLWDASITNSGDTSSFVGQSIFTVIGDGDTVADSTQFFIYRHSTVNGTGNFVENPNSNADASVADDAAATGSIVIGGNGDFQHDFTNTGATDAFNLVAVPEPSSTTLLGLGGLALIMRRRR